MPCQEISVISNWLYCVSHKLKSGKISLKLLKLKGVEELTTSFLEKESSKHQLEIDGEKLLLEAFGTKSNSLQEHRYLKYIKMVSAKVNIHFKIDR